MKTIEINGMEFEVIKPRKRTSNNLTIGEKDLAQCYARPSQAKQAIYNVLEQWFYGAPECISFGIESYNTFQFVISGIYHSSHLYGIYKITRDHNRLFVLYEY